MPSRRRLPHNRHDPFPVHEGGEKTAQSPPCSPKPLKAAVVSGPKRGETPGPIRRRGGSLHVGRLIAASLRRGYPAERVPVSGALRESSVGRPFLFRRVRPCSSPSLTG